MHTEYVLYGAPGWGSTLVEIMLTLTRAPFRFVDVDGFDEPGPARDRLIALNPMAQVPTLVLPDGQVMTESAAITLLLDERFPEAGLAPPPNSAERPAFLRRLIWLTASVYSTFTYTDYPERFAPEATESLERHALEHRQMLWKSWEADLPEGDWALGSTSSALDIYIAVMTRWRPRRAWFAAECPKLFAIAERAEALPGVADVIASNFPD